MLSAVIGLIVNDNNYALVSVIFVDLSGKVSFTKTITNNYIESQLENASSDTVLEAQQVCFVFLFTSK